MTHPPIGQQRQPQPPKEAPPDVWQPVDGKRHLEQNQRGEWRTKPTGG